MIKLLGAGLGIYFISLIIYFYGKTKDLLHPYVLFLGLEFLSYVPGMFIFTSESSIDFTISGCLTVCIFEILYTSFVIIGLNFSNTIYIKSKNDEIDPPMLNICLCFMVGFAAKILVINKIGGFSYVLNNGQLAYLRQSHGFGIYTIFYKFMFLAILSMLEKCNKHRNKRRYKIYTVIMIVVYAASFLIYTSRTPALILVLITLFIYNFEFKKINIRKLFNWKFILVFALCLSVAYSATLSRKSSTNKMETSLVTDMFYNYTHIGRDICVYDYFSVNPKWHGKGYLNILPSINPFVRSKPSTDDGIYLTNIIRNNYVDINANSDELPYQTGSVPFTTPAYMYANFGVLGIALGGLIMGLVIGLFYKYMIRNKDTYSITIYFYIIYSFGLSTGKLVPTAISIVFIYVFKNLMKIRIQLK